VVGFLMYRITQLPLVAAWIGVTLVLTLFGTWAVWAMLHTIHARDVAAEIPDEAVLAEPLPERPRVSGRGPVR
jgi:hypothetical protein